MHRRQNDNVSVKVSTKELSVARLPLPVCRLDVAALVVMSLFVSSAVWAQQPDPRVLANPRVKRTLQVDPSTWQTNAALSPEVRAKVEATIARVEPTMIAAATMPRP